MLSSGTLSRPSSHSVAEGRACSNKPDPSRTLRSYSGVLVFWREGQRPHCVNPRIPDLEKDHRIASLFLDDSRLYERGLKTRTYLERSNAFPIDMSDADVYLSATHSFRSSPASLVGSIHISYLTAGHPTTHHRLPAIPRAPS